MENLTLDMVVIGSGPAGQKAAIQASKLGKTVAVIEKDIHPGGACLNSATIPSKTLRAAILDLSDFYSRSFYGKNSCPRILSINDLTYRLHQVFEIEREIVRRQFRKNHIQLITGHAYFESKNIVVVKSLEDKILYRIRAEYIMIGVGSKPRNPIEVPFDDKVILDSTRLLSIDKLPKTMIVLGGGIIGSEYASFFAVLGTKVHVVDKKDHLLPLLDREIGIHLQTALSDIGLTFTGKKEPKKISNQDGHAVLECMDGEVIEADVLLFALGRTANVDNLHIENAGIHLDNYGYVPVNDMFQTPTSNIYAIGDVIGAPALASTGMEQGRLAALHAYGIKTHQFPSVYPIGIYTIPEISCCGYTESQLQDLGFHYEVGRAYYYEIACSHINGSGDIGMFKILFHADTLEILGIHIIGRGATEVIHIGQVAMTFNVRIDYFINQVFNYPTYAEGYRIAALNGYNKIGHK